jgi:hypothetical protein
MPTLYICYVALYRCGHYDITKLQIEKARLAIVGLFYVWNKVKRRFEVKGNRLKEKNKPLKPTLYICYVTFYRCRHHDIARLQIEKAASEMKRLFYVCRKANGFEPSVLTFDMCAPFLILRN